VELLEVHLRRSLRSEGKKLVLDLFFELVVVLIAEARIIHHTRGLCPQQFALVVFLASITLTRGACHATRRTSVTTENNRWQ
jgi:hypothetical protein